MQKMKKEPARPPFLGESPISRIQSALKSNQFFLKRAKKTTSRFCRNLFMHLAARLSCCQNIEAWIFYRTYIRTLFSVILEIFNSNFERFFREAIKVGTIDTVAWNVCTRVRLIYDRTHREVERSSPGNWSSRSFPPHDNKKSSPTFYQT